MAKPGHTGIKRIIKAAGYSMQGFRACFQHESAFRQEVALMLVTVPVALIFGEGALEKALLISSILLVLIVELLNSGIEAVVDRHGDDWHELAGRAKDIGSAAVFVALVNMAVVWGFAFVPRLMA